MAVTQAVPTARPELPGAGTPQPPWERPRAGGRCCPQPGEGSWGGRAGRAMHRHRSRMMLSRERVQVTFLCPPLPEHSQLPGVLGPRAHAAGPFCRQTASAQAWRGQTPRGARARLCSLPRGAGAGPPRASRSRSHSHSHTKSPARDPGAPGRPDPLLSPPSWMPGPGLGTW